MLLSSIRTNIVRSIFRHNGANAKTCVRSGRDQNRPAPEAAIFLISHLSPPTVVDPVISGIKGVFGQLQELFRCVFVIILELSKKSIDVVVWGACICGIGALILPISL